MSQRYIGGLIYNPPGGFSGYFDGVNNTAISAPANAAFAFGTGDFTVEAWIFTTNLSGENFVFDTRSSASTAGMGFSIEPSTGKLRYSGSANNVLTSSGIAANQWFHVAWVRSGTTLTGYINGVSAGSVSNSDNLTQNNGVVGRVAFSTAATTGFLSNVRVLKGTALYTSNFNTPTGQLQAITNTSLLTCAYSTFRDGSTNNFTITVNGNTAVSTQNPFPLTTLPNPALGNQGNGVYSMSQYQALKQQNLWPAIDPYWKNVTLLLHGNGTNGAQNNTFLDSSTNNFTITRNGNTTQGTFSPYGDNWSNYFDGSGDYLSVPDNAALDLSTGDFTIECWVFPVTGISDVDGVISKRSQSTFSGGDWRIAYRSASTAFGIATGSNNTDRLTPAITLNAWNHIAFVRSSGTLSCYANGTRGDNLTWTENLDNPEALLIGLNTAGYDFPGYISNVRIVKGTAVYSGSTYTVPTSPLTAITNTSLLTCQSNRFIDNSSNAFTITRNGDVSVQRFSPFNPTAPYAASTIGGSGYFDGSGDYLDTSISNNIIPTSGNFTFEGWIYPTASTNGHFAYLRGNDNGYAAVRLQSDAGQINLYVSTDGTSFAINTGPVGTAPVNAWSHIALVRNGGTFTLYINGVSAFTSTAIASGTSLMTGTVNYIGVLRFVPSGTLISYYSGYASSFRVVTSAVYTSAFTPPTSPLTAITNTSLLLNFTNAGIIDNAEMNNLETVGNAQISTAQSKFGGGSMAFDGSGDYLVTVPKADIELGSGDYTIECWINVSAAATNGGVISKGPVGSLTNTTWSIEFNGSGNTLSVFIYNANNSFYIINGTSNVKTSTWIHVALTRSGNSTRFFINGTQEGSTYTSGYTIAAGDNLYIGGGFYAPSTRTITGYIDDLRITKGYARYTTSFTPQRSQWQDQ